MPICELTVTGHLDGIALRFGGEVVEVFPTLAEAEAAKVAALLARADLSGLFAQPKGSA